MEGDYMNDPETKKIRDEMRNLIAAHDSVDDQEHPEAGVTSGVFEEDVKEEEKNKSSNGAKNGKKDQGGTGPKKRVSKKDLEELLLELPKMDVYKGAIPAISCYDYIQKFLEKKREREANEKNGDGKKKKKRDVFRYNAKTFFLTYAQCPLEKEVVMDFFKEFPRADAKQIIVARERHVLKDKNGQEIGLDQTGKIKCYKHLHVYIVFANTIDDTDPRLFDVEGYHPFILHPTHIADCIRYVIKDGDYISFGIDPDFELEAMDKKTSVTLLKLIRKDITISEAFKENPNLMRNGSNIKKSMEIMEEEQTLKELKKLGRKRTLKCFWIVGPAGIGKTFLIKSRFFNTCYCKTATNKWWDGYDKQKVVILDDFPKNTDLEGDLKLWSDKYSFIAEIKGSTVRPVHDVLIVTSNYSIKDIFLKKPEPSEYNQNICFMPEKRKNELITSWATYLAIKRRFKLLDYSEIDFGERIKKLPKCIDNLPFDYESRSYLHQCFNIPDDTDEVKKKNDEKREKIAKMTDVEFYNYMTEKEINGDSDYDDDSSDEMPKEVEKEAGPDEEEEISTTAKKKPQKFHGGKNYILDEEEEKIAKFVKELITYGKNH